MKTATGRIEVEKCPKKGENFPLKKFADSSLDSFSVSWKELFFGGTNGARWYFNNKGRFKSCFHFRWLHYCYISVWVDGWVCRGLRMKYRWGHKRYRGITATKLSSRYRNQTTLLGGLRPEIIIIHTLSDHLPEKVGTTSITSHPTLKNRNNGSGIKKFHE